jgi:hypothetical protein
MLGGRGRLASRVAVLAALAIVASACSFGGPGGGPGLGSLSLQVGPPGAHGDHVLTVDAPGVHAPGPYRLRLDTDRSPRGAVIDTTVTSLPAQVTLPGGSVPDRKALLYGTLTGHHAFAAGVVLVDGRLRLNQLQVKGTHNSYHVQPSDPPFNGVAEWQFTHSPLPVQFESEGIRQIELDVYVNPDGPTKVLHVPDVDFGTTCATYVLCLQNVKAWSDAHPHHVPIAILTELNDDYYNLPTPVYPWTASGMDKLDGEIRSVFAPGDVITPDSIRGAFPTMDAAIKARGWPAIDDVRGKVMFLMDNGGHYRDDYLAGHPALQGRMIFTNSSPGQADAAFVKMNDPQDPDIPGTVAAGYVVRTRADADTHEARDNNTVPRDAAIASGAQWVSTDYPVPGRAYGQPYFVSIPGGMPSRCNPVTAPSWCQPSLLAG